MNKTNHKAHQESKSSIKMHKTQSEEQSSSEASQSIYKKRKLPKPNTANKKVLREKYKTYKYLIISILNPKTASFKITRTELDYILQDLGSCSRSIKKMSLIYLSIYIKHYRKSKITLNQMSSLIEDSWLGARGFFLGAKKFRYKKVFLNQLGIFDEKLVNCVLKNIEKESQGFRQNYDRAGFEDQILNFIYLEEYENQNQLASIFSKKSQQKTHSDFFGDSSSRSLGSSEVCPSSNRERKFKTLSIETNSLLKVFNNKSSDKAVKDYLRSIPELGRQECFAWIPLEKEAQRLNYSMLSEGTTDSEDDLSSGSEIESEIPEPEKYLLNRSIKSRHSLNTKPKKKTRKKAALRKMISIEEFSVKDFKGKLNDLQYKSPHTLKKEISRSVEPRKSKETKEGYNRQGTFYHRRKQRFQLKNRRGSKSVNLRSKNGDKSNKKKPKKKIFDRKVYKYGFGSPQLPPPSMIENGLRSRFPSGNRLRVFSENVSISTLDQTGVPASKNNISLIVPTPMSREAMKNKIGSLLTPVAGKRNNLQDFTHAQSEAGNRVTERVSKEGKDKEEKGAMVMALKDHKTRLQRRHLPKISESTLLRKYSGSVSKQEGHEYSFDHEGSQLDEEQNNKMVSLRIPTKNKMISQVNQQGHHLDTIEGPGSPARMLFDRSKRKVRLPVPKIQTQLARSGVLRNEGKEPNQDWLSASRYMDGTNIKTNNSLSTTDYGEKRPKSFKISRKRPGGSENQSSLVHSNKINRKRINDVRSRPNLAPVPALSDLRVQKSKEYLMELTQNRSSKRNPIKRGPMRRVKRRTIKSSNSNTPLFRSQLEKVDFNIIDEPFRNIIN